MVNDFSNPAQDLFLPVLDGMPSGAEGDTKQVDRLSLLQTELVGVALLLDLLDIAS